MNLVEVTICDQVFVIAFDAETTVARLAEAALTEYQTAFFERVPSKVKYVQDHKRRILSGTLLVSDSSVEKALIVELIDSDAGGARRPPKDDICGQYRMWQEYSATRAKQALESMADSPSRADPTDSFLDMLQDLRRSRFKEVQTHTVDALVLLLDYFRNKKYAMFAMQELQMVVHESAFPEVALSALRKISTSRTSHKYIYPCTRLSKDMTRLLKGFDEAVQSDFFDLLDYLESAAADGVDAGAPAELVAAERVSRSPLKAPTDSAEEVAADDPSAEADAKETPAVSSDGDSKASSDNARAEKDGSLERMLALLASEEQRNRQYAVLKAVSRVWAFSTDPQSSPSSTALEPMLGRLVAALLACLKASLKPPPSPRAREAKDGSDGVKAALVASLALNSPSSDVLTAQLCLRCLCLLGIYRPLRVRHSLRTCQHSSGSYCRLLATLAHCREPLAVMETGGDPKVEAAVKLIRTDIPRLRTAAAFSGIPSVSSLYSLPLADAAALLLLVAMRGEHTHPAEEEGPGGQYSSPAADTTAGNFNELDALEHLGFDMSADAAWASPLGCGVRLEERAVALLLQTEAQGDRHSVSAPMAPPRVEFALAYLLHTSLVSGSAPAPSLHLSREEPERKGAPGVSAASSQTEFIKMMTAQDFTLCKLLWRWLTSGCRRPAILAACILGNASTVSSVRSFFLQHRSTVSKVLELLETCVTVTFDRHSGDFVTSFDDDRIRSSCFLMRRARDSGEDKADGADSLQQQYTEQCLLWTANSNSIVVRYLLKLLSNLISSDSASEHVEATKAVLRRLVKSDDTAAVFGAMLEANDILAFYFRLIMQQNT